ncbi:MAG: hypothetical protein JXR56_08005 [Candidatus Cloacimonetes bacterium]|nr:hypothetical protein [Candidatus Cloacimonadota bacterium]
MKFRLLIIAFLLLILSGCSIFQTGFKSERKALEHNLSLWESFHMDGIVEVNYQAFSIRKNFALNKDGNEFHFTVFNAGLMGLNPKPLLKVDYVDSLTIDTSGFPGLSDSLPANIHIEELPFDFSVSKYLLPKSDEIMLNKKALLKKMEFNFNNKMQLSYVTFSKKDKVTFEYEFNGYPKEVCLVHNDKKFLTLQIDNYKKQ